MMSPGKNHPIPLTHTCYLPICVAVSYPIHLFWTDLPCSPDSSGTQTLSGDTRTTHTHTFTQNNIIIYSLVLKLLCLSVENLGQYIINWTVGIPTVQLLVDDRFNLSTNSTSLQIINIQTIHVQSLKYTLIPYHKIFFCYYTNINCYYCYYAKNLNRVRPDILQ